MLDRGELGRGTSHVSAGMLAPISEADAGEQALLRLGLESARAWPAFAAELQEASGVGVDYRAQGTLLVARDRDEAEALDRELALRARFGLRAERLLPVARAPRSSPRSRRRSGSRSTCRTTTRSIRGSSSRRSPARPSAPARCCARAPRSSRSARARASSCAAASASRPSASWSPRGRGRALPGVPEDARVPVRPVKGQSLRLRDPGGAGLIERVVRWDGGYLVPRTDGRYVLGATMEERGFDTR